MRLPYTKSDADRVAAGQEAISDTESDLNSELVVRAQTCIPHGPFRLQANASERCIRCLADPLNCPADKCICT